MASLHIIPLLATCLLLLVFLFQRHQRLRSVPGPWLASWTNLWRAYSQNYRNFADVLLQLHEQYGPLVRIGPNVVSVSDARAVSTIFTMHGEFEKVRSSPACRCLLMLKVAQADSYRPLRSFINGQVRGSIIDMQDETQNTGMRRAIGGAFSAKNMLEYEEDVETAMAALVDRLRQSPDLQLFEVLQQFQMDFLMKIAFSEPPHFLKTQEETRSWSFEARYLHWKRWQGLPKLEHLLYKSPLATRFIKTTTPIWGRLAAEKLQAREKMQDISPGRRDLLNKYMAASMTHSELVDGGILLRLVASTISAGFDTT